MQPGVKAVRIIRALDTFKENIILKEDLHKEELLVKPKNVL